MLDVAFDTDPFIGGVGDENVCIMKQYNDINMFIV